MVCFIARDCYWPHCPWPQIIPWKTVASELFTGVTALLMKRNSASFQALEDRSCSPAQTTISWGHRNTFAISNRLEQSQCHLWWWISDGTTSPKFEAPHGGSPALRATTWIADENLWRRRAGTLDEERTLGNRWISGQPDLHYGIACFTALMLRCKDELWRGIKQYLDAVNCSFYDVSYIRGADNLMRRSCLSKCLAAVVVWKKVLFFVFFQSRFTCDCKNFFEPIMWRFLWYSLKYIITTWPDPRRSMSVCKIPVTMIKLEFDVEDGVFNELFISFFKTYHLNTARW